MSEEKTSRSIFEICGIDKSREDEMSDKVFELIKQGNVPKSITNIIEDEELPRNEAIAIAIVIGRNIEENERYHNETKSLVDQLKSLLQNK